MTEEVNALVFISVCHGKVLSFRPAKSAKVIPNEHRYFNGVFMLVGGADPRLVLESLKLVLVSVSIDNITNNSKRTEFYKL